MGWLRYPRTPLEMLIAGAATLAVTVVLFSIMTALFATAGAFAAAGGALILIFVWDFAVERPKRLARRAEALAAQSRPIDDIPLQTEAGRADWSERLPGPVGAVVRTAPATIAALLIIGAAVGINALLGDLVAPEGDVAGDGGDVRVRLESGAAGDIRQEGDFTRSLRVTLLSVRQWAGDSGDGKKYWAAEVQVKNTGRVDASAPAWTLRAGYEEYGPVSADAPGEQLGDGFTLPQGESRTGWLVFEIYLDEWPQWLRARLPDYPSVYFQR